MTPGLTALTRQLRALCIPRPWAFADLSLGAWRGHQTGLELLGQLGITPDLPNADSDHDRKGALRVLAYADFISAGVAAESRGNTAALAARRLADQVAAAAASGQVGGIIVLAPRFDLRWEAEDILFLRFLAARLSEPARLVIVCPEPGGLSEFGGAVQQLIAILPSDPALASSLTALVPGIITPDVSSLLDPAVPALALSDGQFLIAPDCRRPPERVERLEYDRLHAALGHAGQHRLAYYAQCLGNTIYVDPSGMAEQAWTCLAEGGEGPALRFLERAVECARFSERQWLAVQLQGMRLALGRFSDAAGAPDPSPAYPRQIRGFLLAAKGWGQVMTRRSAEGDQCLTAARSLLHPDDGLREYLYLLNITALGKLRIGALDEALRLEQEIEVRRAGLAASDWALGYLNSLNLARLHLRRDDLVAARRSYGRAFAVTEGSRSDSERIYQNICWARLETAAGRPAEAFQAWLRAALHWACAEVPEALGARAAAALLGRWPDSTEEIVEEFTEALIGELGVAADRGGLKFPAERDDRYGFTRPGAGPLPTETTACGAPGWAVLAAPLSLPPARERARLTSLLGPLVGELVPSRDLRNARTFLVAEEIPSDLPSTLALCLRHDVRRVRFADIELELDREQRVRLEAAATVRLSQAVEHIADHEVVFRREFAPRSLGPAEKALVTRCLGDGSSFNALLTSGATKDLVRNLENARVLTVHITESACSAAGIRLPTSATSTKR